MQVGGECACHPVGELGEGRLPTVRMRWGFAVSQSGLRNQRRITTIMLDNETSASSVDHLWLVPLQPTACSDSVRRAEVVSW